MMRRACLFISLIGLSACGGAVEQTANTVQTSVAATLSAIAVQPSATGAASTPVPSRTATRRASPTRTPRPTPASSPTPDPLVWDALTSYRDVGVPLPKSARAFGGGIYVPDSSFVDLQTASFGDDVAIGAGAYFPNDYSGEEPVRLPDGTGVDHVEFFIFDPNDAPVYQINDDEPPFCLFGDVDGTCTTLHLPDNGCQWPTFDGLEAGNVTAGFHRLDVVLFGPDDAAETWSATLDLQPPPGSPCAAPRAITQLEFALSACCNDEGQRNDDVLSDAVQVTTSGYLGVEIFTGSDACSDAAFHLFVDDGFVTTTEFIGPLSDSIITGLYEMGELSPGLHTLRLSPEGRPGGCNTGTLGGWSATVNVYVSE